jgi:hypothetical protein
MDGASAVAGLIGLAALVLHTTLKIRSICEGYSAAQEDIEGVSRALQSLQDLLEETQRLAGNPAVVKASTVLTRTRYVPPKHFSKRYANVGLQNGKPLDQLRQRPEKVDTSNR